jgi:hypothetical protein
MVSTDAGWHCPQCGSAIVGGQPAKAAAPTHENATGARSIKQQDRALLAANRGVYCDSPKNS